MTTEYRVISLKERGRWAQYGPTKRKDLAENVLAGREVQYAWAAPWVIEAREIGDWEPLTR